MARIRISAALLDDFLFKGLDARITGASWFSEFRQFEFVIEGDDVPDSKEAIIICKSYHEPGDDDHVKVEIISA